MGNYNSVCEVEECRTKRRKLEKDVFYCKYHRCGRFLCNLLKTDNTNFCVHHK